jgi:hypothetical protein
MTITKKKILEALGIDYPVTRVELSTALLETEKILHRVADFIEDDFESAVLGDVSNLVQLIREGL